jgi:hypothetical protein
MFLVIRIALPAMAVAAALSAPARAGDGPFVVVGKVQSVNLDERTMQVVDSRDGRVRTVMMGAHSDLQLSKGRKIPLSRLKPGAIVSVRDSTVASEVIVGGEYLGTIRSIDGSRLTLTQEASGKDVTIELDDTTKVEPAPGTESTTHSVAELKPGARVIVIRDVEGEPATSVIVEHEPASILHDFWDNFRHNLFKPLLLFFYMGFLVPILRVKFEFPYVMYQALTIFLLIAIGWHGGEELSALSVKELGGAVGFMGVGFLTNCVIGLLAYGLLSLMTRMRRVDKATVAGYYGSDSAGTFVTCLGVLASAGILYQAYMPVMLAVMEIPGCLVALFLVSRLRHKGMDPAGTMPDEPGYDPHARPALAAGIEGHGHGGHGETVEEIPAEEVTPEQRAALEEERELALEKRNRPTHYGRGPSKLFSPQLLHEVFLNPGLYLLFGGIIVGYLSGLQGKEVTRADDNFFVDLFQGVLCLFLLEMGMTASRKLKDLKTAGPGFVAFGLLAPNLFATIGILVAHAYALLTHTPFELGTYVLFSVLCGAASYIAVPAVQRLAIPEASPTLPLAASLGLTFTYNVTIGIPVYIEIAKAVLRAFPLANGAA